MKVIVVDDSKTNKKKYKNKSDNGNNIEYRLNLFLEWLILV